MQHPTEPTLYLITLSLFFRIWDGCLRVNVCTESTVPNILDRCLNNFSSSLLQGLVRAAAKQEAAMHTQSSARQHSSHMDAAIAQLEAWATKNKTLVHALQQRIRAMIQS